MIDAPPPTSEPSSDHHARRDPALHHRGAQRAGVEVDEALVHDRRARGQVRAQSHPVGVGDAHAGGHHVVDHPRELVDAVDGHRTAPAQPGPDRLEALDGARAVVGPHHVGEHPEEAVGVQAVRGDQAMREQVQPQIRVVGVGGLVLQRRRSRCAPATISVPRSSSRPASSASSPGTSATDSRTVPGAPNSPSSGAGNQVSRTDPSAASVANPIPEAPVTVPKATGRDPDGPISVLVLRTPSPYVMLGVRCLRQSCGHSRRS